ncbi:MAG: hypothetical protein JNM07_00075 [Phycisphaerae bacterium]|nr:hypothetical protein [Phycisphaerae bacterium]
MLLGAYADIALSTDNDAAATQYGETRSRCNGRGTEPWWTYEYTRLDDHGNYGDVKTMRYRDCSFCNSRGVR